MELNHNRVGLNRSRYPEVQRASDARTAEIRETVDRVQRSVSEQTEQASRLTDSSDSIELSIAARGFNGEDGAVRQERIDELRAAAADGSLFNHDRLARAAERLLTGE